MAKGKIFFRKHPSKRLYFVEYSSPSGGKTLSVKKTKAEAKRSAKWWRNNKNRI